jgi:hypothetical protein
MLRSSLLAFVLAFVFVCVPQSSFAALHALSEFSAQTPDDWKFYRDDSVISFTAPDDSADISIFLERPEKPNLQEIARTWAGQNPVKTLADKSIIWEDSAGSRYWGMLADDGIFASIATSAPYDGLEAFLANLKAAESEKGLTQIFKAVQNKDAVAWLGFATP